MSKVTCGCILLNQKRQLGLLLRVNTCHLSVPTTGMPVHFAVSSRLACHASTDAPLSKGRLFIEHHDSDSYALNVSAKLDDARKSTRLSCRQQQRRCPRTEQASSRGCRAGNQPAGGAASVAVMRFHLSLKSPTLIFETIILNQEDSTV